MTERELDRTLVIMRHAKAEQPEAIADIDRPLSERGRADAAAAGAWLAGSGITVDLVLCSPAKRTRATWHEVAVGFADKADDPGTSPTVHYERDLYHSGLAASLELIRATDPSIRTILLIGHNPTVSALSLRLDESAARDSDGIATGGLAVHSVPTEWAGCVAAPLIASHTARGKR